MKRPVKLTFAGVAVLLVLACAVVPAGTGAPISVPTVAPGAINTPAEATSPVAAPTSGATQVAGAEVSFSGVSFTIPQGLASGAACETVPAVSGDNGAPWDLAPAYIRCTLQGYPLQGMFFEPQIMVYPAPEYAAANQSAAESIQRIQTILASPSPALSNDLLPHLPWANAAQQIGAQPVVLNFNGGAGVRVLTQYSQYFAPINNHELFYHFEGLSGDGKSLVATTLPVNAAFLVSSSDPAAALPPDGIAYPGFDNQDPNVWTNYYDTVTNRLSTTTPESFQPSLALLDTLIGTLAVAP